MKIKNLFVFSFLIVFFFSVFANTQTIYDLHEYTEEDLFIRSGVGYRNLSQAPVYYLEGVWIDQRLVAIYSDKGYSKCWDKDYDNDPQLKSGVNMVVFSLIQEGGIALRHMEIFSAAK